MIANFTPQETEFLCNLLIDKRYGFYLGAPPDTEVATINNISNKLILAEIDFTQQEVGYLQYIIAEQAEINGSRRSVANEKAFMGPGTTFVPTQTLIYIKSIGDKLGADMSIDTTTRSTGQPTARAEGSTWIMTNPLQKPIIG
jgi:hypothetical protein